MKRSMILIGLIGLLLGGIGQPIQAKISSGKVGELQKEYNKVTTNQARKAQILRELSTGGYPAVALQLEGAPAKGGTPIASSVSAAEQELSKKIAQSEKKSDEINRELSDLSEQLSTSKSTIESLRRDEESLNREKDNEEKKQRVAELDRKIKEETEKLKEKKRLQALQQQEQQRLQREQENLRKQEEVERQKREQQIKIEQQRSDAALKSVEENQKKIAAETAAKAQRDNLILRIKKSYALLDGKKHILDDKNTTLEQFNEFIESSIKFMRQNIEKFDGFNTYKSDPEIKALMKQFDDLLKYAEEKRGLKQAEEAKRAEEERKRKEEERKKALEKAFGKEEEKVGESSGSADSIPQAPEAKINKSGEKPATPINLEKGLQAEIKKREEKQAKEIADAQAKKLVGDVLGGAKEKATAAQKAAQKKNAEAKVQQLIESSDLGDPNHIKALNTEIERLNSTLRKARDKRLDRYGSKGPDNIDYDNHDEMVKNQKVMLSDFGGTAQQQQANYQYYLALHDKLKDLRGSNKAGWFEYDSEALPF